MNDDEKKIKEWLIKEIKRSEEKRRGKIRSNGDKVNIVKKLKTRRITNGIKTKKHDKRSKERKKMETK